MSKNLLEKLADICMKIQGEEACVGCSDDLKEWVSRMSRLYDERDEIVQRLIDERKNELEG